MSGKLGSEKPKFSFSFLTYHPSVGDLILNRGFDCIAEAAQKAEKLGFEGFFLSDHFMEPKPKNNVIYEAWTALTALAPQTVKIRLGTCVTPIQFYRPGVLAKRVASLDSISGGRVIFGAGCGWNGEEFTAYGVPFDPHRVRIEKMIEEVELIKALWTNERPVFYHGKYYRLKGAELLPKPVQKPHPPIWFGGESNKILEIVAKHGDGWIPGGTRMTPSQYELKAVHLRRLLKEAKRVVGDVTFAIALRSIVADTSQEVKNRVERIILTQEDQKIYIDDPRVILGTPKECIETIRRYVKSGVDHFVIALQPVEDISEGLQIYSEEVIPYV